MSIRNDVYVECMKERDELAIKCAVYERTIAYMWDRARSIGIPFRNPWPLEVLETVEKLDAERQKRGTRSKTDAGGEVL